MARDSLKSKHEEICEMLHITLCLKKTFAAASVWPPASSKSKATGAAGEAEDKELLWPGFHS